VGGPVTQLQKVGGPVPPVPPEITPMGRSTCRITIWLSNNNYFLIRTKLLLGLGEKFKEKVLAIDMASYTKVIFRRPE
jgi:hypothetical protein